MFILPQVALQRLIQEGIKAIKANPDILDKVFAYYTCDWANADYGTNYINLIKTWFVDSRIPVVQAWSLNTQIVPQIAIRLSSEQEDTSKTALGDHYYLGGEGSVGMSPFTVNLEVLVMASLNSDESLWLYYIVLYILFKTKRRAEQMGLELQTVSASDMVRDLAKLADNIWVRSIRFSTIVQHQWDDQEYLDIDDLELEVDAESASTGIRVEGV